MQPQTYEDPGPHAGRLEGWDDRGVVVRFTELGARLSGPLDEEPTPPMLVLFPWSAIAYTVVTVYSHYAGGGKGELLGLKWSDLDLATSRLSIPRALKVTDHGLDFGPPKNNASRRSVPLSKTAVAALRAHRTRQSEERLRLGDLWQDYDLVFPNRVGKPMDHGNLYDREYKPLLQKAGLGDRGFTFHSLRHTFATELFNQRKRPKIIQSLLGHSSIIQTMDTYSHLLDDVDDDEVGGLDEAFG